MASDFGAYTYLFSEVNYYTRLATAMLQASTEKT